MLIDKVRNNNITLEKRLTNNDISKVFKDYMLGGGIPTSSDYEFGKLFIGKPFVFDIYKSSTKSTWNPSVEGIHFKFILMQSLIVR